MIENNLKILILEDSEIEEQLIIAYIKKSAINCTYKSCSSKVELVHLIQNNAFDLIICDYYMPEMSGLVVIEILKLYMIDIPLVLVSGKLDENLILEVMEWGAYDYVPKSNLIRLVACLKRIYKQKIKQKKIDKKINFLEERVKLLENEMYSFKHKYKDTNKSNLEIIQSYINQSPKSIETSFLFEFLFNNLSDAILIKNLNSKKYVYANKNVHNVFGIFANDFIDQFDSDIFSNKISNEFENLDKIIEIEKSNNIYSLEIENYSNKTSKIYQIIKIFVENSNEDSDFVFTIIKQIENTNFVKNEGISKEIFLNAPIAIMIEDVDKHEILDYNLKASNLFFEDSMQYKAKDILKLSIWNGSTEFNKIRNEALVYGAFSNKEIAIKHNNVSKIILLSGNLFSYENTAILIYMGIDVTNIMKVDEEKELALKRQLELLTLKNTFVSMISHEFRTPLTTIMLSNDLLKRYGDKWTIEDKEKHYDRIQHTVLQMTKLMENVLLIGKIDNGQFLLRPEEVDVIELCRTIVSNLSYSFNNKHNIIINSNDYFSEVKIDEKAVSLIIHHILSNSIKYCQTNAEITFNVNISHNLIKFEIIDNGIGIPIESLDHVFESFYRGSNVAQIEGYGLGLSIVSKCVEIHKGHVEIKSELGKGTTVIVEIPNNLQV